MAVKKKEVVDPVLVKKRGVFACGCTGKSSPDAAKYQDEVYGKGNRLHTIGGGKDKPSYTCTVCGKER